MVKSVLSNFWQALPFAGHEVHLLSGARSARGGRQIKPNHRARQIMLDVSSKTFETSMIVSYK
jgi:hypothetical protein